MSDYHIQEVATDNKTISAVFHIPVPGGTNTAGNTWRESLVAYSGGADAIESNLINIPGPEIAAMKSGAIVEQAVIIKFSSINLTNQQRISEVETAYATERDKITTELSAKLEFYGYEGDVD